MQTRSLALSSAIKVLATRLLGTRANENIKQEKLGGLREALASDADTRWGEGDLAGQTNVVLEA